MKANPIKSHKFIMVLMMICGSIGFVSCNDEDIVTADDESLRSYELITLQELSGYGSICI